MRGFVLWGTEAMRFHIHPFLATVLLSVALCLASSDVCAFTCDMLVMNVDYARIQLRRAAGETDLDAAKDYARRAKNALTDAAMSAMDCRCSVAHIEFDIAASYARRARDADTAEEFVDSLNRAIRAFNSALRAVQACASGFR
jgi:hypothetical protein